MPILSKEWTRPKRHRIKEFAACLFILLAVLLLGSEGPYFPWVNLAGLAVIMGAVISLVGVRGL